MFTADQYRQMVTARCEANKKAETGFVLTDASSMEARLWFAYWHRIGLPYAWKLAHLKQGNPLTVPTRWPQDYDTGWKPSPRDAEVKAVGRKSSEMTLEERERVMRLFYKIMGRAMEAGVALPKKRSRDMRDAVEIAAEQAADEAALLNASAPMPKLSAAALAKMSKGEVGESRFLEMPE